MVILFGLVPRTIPFSLFSFDWYRVQACSFFFVDPFRSHPIQTTMCCICFSRCWTRSRASSNHTTTHSVHLTLSSTMADVAGATVVRTRHLSFQLHFSWNDSSSQSQSIIITIFHFSFADSVLCRVPLSVKPTMRRRMCSIWERLLET